MCKGMIIKYNGTEEAERHIFGSQNVGEMQKRNFTIWGMKAGGSAEAEPQLFGSQDRAEVQKRNFTSLTIKAEC